MRRRRELEREIRRVWCCIGCLNNLALGVDEEKKKIRNTFYYSRGHFRVLRFLEKHQTPSLHQRHCVILQGFRHHLLPRTPHPPLKPHEKPLPIAPLYASGLDVRHLLFQHAMIHQPYFSRRVEAERPATPHPPHPLIPRRLCHVRAVAQEL